VRQEVAILALCVWGQLGQVTEKAQGVVLVVMRDAVGGGAHRGVRKAGVEGRRVPAWRAVLALRSALQVWSMAIVSKCMFILPLVDSILKRGGDERDVKNGMSSFTNFESFFFCAAWAQARAWAWLGVRVGFRLCLSCSCTG